MDTGRRRAGPEATSLWRRLLAVLLGLSLLLSLVQAPTLVADNPARASSITALVIEELSRAASDQSDDGIVQHCASCPCHQAVQLSCSVPMQARLTARLRFDLRDENVSDWATAPPSRPPAV